MQLFFSLTPVWSSALVALQMATAVATSSSTERHPFHEPVPPVAERLKGPATMFADLSPGECTQQLKLVGEVGSAFQTQGPSNGIATPVRVVGPVGEILFQVPPPQVAFGLLDCRQALLWIQLLPILREHHVAKIRIDSFYRNQARISRRGKKSQHSYGLAADLVSFTLDDGTLLDVQNDFLGRRGEPPCGPTASIHPTATATPEQVERAVEIRNLVCEFARMGAFHHILTPNYDKAHESHLHVDIKRDNTWFSIN